MTPKEKAENLIVKYMSFEVNAVYEDLDGDTAVLSETMTYHSAKQCALIAVDEILGLLNLGSAVVIYYWIQVKKEIEKL